MGTHHVIPPKVYERFYWAPKQDLVQFRDMFKTDRDLLATQLKYPLEMTFNGDYSGTGYRIVIESVEELDLFILILELLTKQ